MTINPPGRRPDPDWLRPESIIALRLLIIGVAIAAAMWLVLQVQFIATAVVLGFAEVALLWPLARWLRSKRVPAVLAALMCVLLFLAFFAGLLVFVVTEVVDSWPRMVDAITGSVSEINRWLEDGPFGMDTQNVQDLLDELESRLGDVLGDVTSAAVGGLSLVGNFVTVILIATFFAIFALTSGDKLWKQFVAALAPTHRDPADAAFRASMRTAGNWFYASTLTGLVDGVLIGVGLLILDVPLAVPIGALTFIMAYIPLVGATLAGAVAVLVALFSGGFTTSLWALGIVVVVQQIEGNILSPLLMSRALNFHPVVTLILTTAAAAAFGLVGLFLAVPVSGAIAAAVLAWRRVTRARELAESGEPPGEDGQPPPVDATAPPSADPPSPLGSPSR
ncbi:AI-2E family transporter [Jiangella alkaliphila]|uniref:Predicted PurR-regulated permease PerM n=1 Tax=Jiangella alkaliphila TaxID=419479 RepID=A0A1H2L0C1_9ACTN|nr:AI-2E family transporter [Jiangella alkaliphila]SDU74194.1 Predicted PurR-regulated permease PerM [Jiangella alkaliphila]